MPTMVYCIIGVLFILYASSCHNQEVQKSRRDGLIHRTVCCLPIWKHRVKHLMFVHVWACMFIFAGVPFWFMSSMLLLSFPSVVVSSREYDRWGIISFWQPELHYKETGWLSVSDLGTLTFTFVLQMRSRCVSAHTDPGIGITGEWHFTITMGKTNRHCTVAGLTEPEITAQMWMSKWIIYSSQKSSRSSNFTKQNNPFINSCKSPYEKRCLIHHRMIVDRTELTKSRICSSAGNNLHKIKLNDAYYAAKLKV